MRLIRVAGASVSVKVGAFGDNLAVIKEVVAAAEAEGVSLLCLPELCLTGYQLEDRVQWPEVADRAWASLESLAQAAPEMAIFAGLPVRAAGLLYNGLALLWGGKIQGVVLKRYLPLYDVFYEGRNFTAWRGTENTLVKGVPAGDLLFRLPWGDVAAQICEDAWTWPATNLPLLLRAEVLCNSSASPFSLFKVGARQRIVQNTAERMQCFHVFANPIGLDSARLVFDGGALVAEPDGSITNGRLLHLDPWDLVTKVVDLDDVVRRRSENTTWREMAASTWARSGAGQEIDLRASGAAKFLPTTEYPLPNSGSFFLSGATAEKLPPMDIKAAEDQLLDALVLGVRDYFHKAGAFKKILVALSGGRDSALALTIGVQAAAALPGEGTRAEKIARTVEARYLTGPFSTPQTRGAAKGLCQEFGVPFADIDINSEFELARATLIKMARGDDPSPLACQNAQARIRGALLLGWANTVSGLLLVTSNLSEFAVGYFTTGGDNQGGFSPLADLPKTLISRLLARAQERWGIASMQAVLALVPSAELAPEQSDEDDLMPYEVLDDILYLYVNCKLRREDISQILGVRHPGVPAETLATWLERFLRLFTANQWKREQSPVALKLLSLDLDPKTGFRYPVIQDID